MIAILGTAVLAAAVSSLAPRPPDGTYVYRLNAGGNNVGTSTLVVSHSQDALTVKERAQYPGIGALTTAHFDPHALQETGYDADFEVNGAMQAVSVAFTGGTATIVAAAQTVPVHATQNAPRMLFFDRLLSSSFIFPAVAHAEPSRTLTLVTNAGTAVAVTWKPAAGTRPSGVPAADLGLRVSIGETTVTMWYQPSDFVLDEMQEPGATVTLASYSASQTPLAPITHPTPVPLSAAQYRSRDVTFAGSQGAELAGTLTIPQSGNGPFPAVVLVHGSGPEDRDETIGPNKIFLQIAHALSNAGFVVLRYDKRSIGKSTGKGSDNQGPIVADARDALNFLAVQPEVDRQRVYMLGHSEGAEVAPIIADSPSPLRGIVIMGAPALPLTQILMQQLTRGMHGAQLEKQRAQTQRELNAHPPKTALAKFAQSWMDPALAIAKIRVPALILQGGKDIQVLPADLPHLVKAARATGRNVTVRIFPDDDHLMMSVPSGPSTGAEYFKPGVVDPAVIDAIIGWLQAH